MTEVATEAPASIPKISDAEKAKERKRQKLKEIEQEEERVLQRLKEEKEKRKAQIKALDDQLSKINQVVYVPTPHDKPHVADLTHEVLGRKSTNDAKQG